MIKIKFSFKKIVIIHIVLIMILIGLIVKIKIQEKEYSCDKCSIIFQKYNELNKDSKYIIEVPIDRLYKGYLNNKCPVEIGVDGSYSFTEYFEIKEVLR